MKNTDATVDKVDVEEIIKNFKVTNYEMFLAYLKEVWMDLAQRSDDKIKGVNKLTFASYYKLPGIIFERLFAVFDTNQNGYIDLLEFLEGMQTLFTGNFDKVSHFIFNFYDFNKDEFITKEDIRTVLSYVTLSKEKIGSIESQNYLDRVQSQDELHEMLENCFTSVKSGKMNYSSFIQVIENTNSDIYFFILLFLLEKKPFSMLGLAEYEKLKSSSDSPKKCEKNIFSTPMPVPTSAKLLASPNINSLFSPCLMFTKSPFERGGSRVSSVKVDNNSANQHMLMNLVGRKKEKSYTSKVSHINALNTLAKVKEIEQEKEAKMMAEVNNSPKIPVCRRPKTNLKDLENQPPKQVSKVDYNELQILPAFKHVTPKLTKFSEQKKPEPGDSTYISGIAPDSEIIMIGTAGKDGVEIESMRLSNQLENLQLNNEENLIEDNNNNELVFGPDEDEEQEELVQYEGYLYKFTDKQKFKKLWFKLLHQDLYYFKKETDKIHTGLHNLSGVFVKEQNHPTIFDGMTYYSFSVVYPKKVRYYYVDNETEYYIWIEKLKKATGYANLTEIYDVKDKLGNGKFGLVRLGVNKFTGKKVAIKIMSKKNMTTQDLELVRTEIEILKVCQHPNIIRLYDVFENEDHFYIIMEHCEGGDLFSYLENRGFKLTEKRACEIIHKMCTALFYIHSYGIAHRDLKPENVLMTSETDDADIRILDFGLSKIVGPGEKCTEPYGTLSYVAPEVLLEQPYTKAVDLWGIGVTTYLLLAGSLPFDHETSEREIARQTINDPVPFKGSIWKKISTEAREFIGNLLEKEPSKRMEIKQALEHPWFQKFCSKVAECRRKSKDMKTSLFQIYTSTDENSSI